MKKILSVILCFVMFVAVSITVVNLFDKNYSNAENEKRINEDLPTEEQINEFNIKRENKCFYYYDCLSEDEKDSYITMYYGFCDFDDSIMFSTADIDVSKVFIAVLYDNPDVFWVELKYEYLKYEESLEFKPQYRISREDASKMSDDVNERIDSIMSEIDSLKSDYDKELYIHNYILDITEYDMDTYEGIGDTVYSSLVMGRSICEGYARTVQILLDKAGIDNYLVTGEVEIDGKIEPHMWNIVNIDGDNYHLDCTWDDINMQDDKVHFYFNVSDEVILRDHMNIEPDGNNCDTMEANYFIVENAYVDEFEGFLKHVDRTAEKLKGGENTVEFYFTNPIDYKNALDCIANDKSFFDFVNKSVKESGRVLNVTVVDYYTIDNYNYLCIVFKEG